MSRHDSRGSADLDQRTMEGGCMTTLHIDNGGTPLCGRSDFEREDLISAASLKRLQASRQCWECKAIAGISEDG